MSKFVYVHIKNLDSRYDKCYDSINNVSELKKCVQNLYNLTKNISSSPLFGTCPTCLGVCADTNYSYSSLNEILFLIDEYEKEDLFVPNFNVSGYNYRAEKLNSIYTKYEKINKTISLSSNEINNLIISHNNYSSIKDNDIVILDVNYDEILKNITIYNEANCKSEFKRFITLNQFNAVLSECLEPVEINNEVEISEQKEESEAAPNNVLFILGASIIILIILKQIMKRYH